MRSVLLVVLFASVGCEDAPKPTAKAKPLEKASAPPTPSPPPKKDAKGVTPKVDEKKTDAKAVALQKADKEAMEAFRAGNRDDGVRKLLESIKPYKSLTPSDCTPQESMALAVIYARMTLIFNGALSEREIQVYIEATRLYSERGGIRSEDRPAWYTDIIEKTNAALAKKHE